MRVVEIMKGKRVRRWTVSDLLELDNYLHSPWGDKLASWRKAYRIRFKRQAKAEARKVVEHFLDLMVEDLLSLNAVFVLPTRGLGYMRAKDLSKADHRFRKLKHPVTGKGSVGVMVRFSHRSLHGERLFYVLKPSAEVALRVAELEAAGHIWK